MQRKAIQHISAKELKKRLDAGEKLTILDVREPWEIEFSHLAHTLNIPMNDIPDSLDQLPKDQPVVVMCHTGMRSQTVVNWLQGQGFDNLLNLSGGIAAWSRDVDPSVPSY